MSSPPRRISLVVRDLCQCHHGIRRCAVGVDECPAETSSFHKCHVPADVGQAVTERISAPTGSDHDGIEFHEFLSSTTEGG